MRRPMLRATTLVTSSLLVVTACARSGGADPRTGTATSGATAATGSGSATSDGAVPGAVLRDVDYVGDRSRSHRLDLHLPSTPGVHPLVVFVHGGAWQMGDKALLDGTGHSIGVEHLRDVLLAQGYAVASVNYRLSSQAPFPAQIHDVKAAIRHLRGEASRLRIDPERIAVMGESAGGHLAQLAGLLGPTRTRTGGADLEGSLGRPGGSSAVKAVVAMYGVADLPHLLADRTAAGCPPSDLGPETALLGVDPSTPAGAARGTLASPLHHVHPGAPPMLLLHGRQDCVVPMAQSQRLSQALTRAGAKAPVVLIDAGHAEPAFYTRPDLQQQVVAFLRANL
ncbi:alpha/beta hydrolase [Arsenicicoccus dermatophilus]|uniref:alpha/beta hydrolase n=1 Tax=Arsenicicoccus dermatophilus TaxID=1076331 RepID=UPI001F4CCE98|nr:alpha/beta hydrolase [Arsenicicoccus dermatophilus]MCH8612050.1 alpha/beta hydrolase [Arsenicicoccus dermatophilus]